MIDISADACVQHFDLHVIVSMCNFAYVCLCIWGYMLYPFGLSFTMAACMCMQAWHSKLLLSVRMCVCVCVFNTSVTQALLNVKRFRTHRKRQIAFYWPDNITMGWEALCALDPCVCVCMCDSCGWWGICSLLYNLLFYYYASVLLCLCQRCFSVLALKFQNTNTVYILNVLKYIFF